MKHFETPLGKLRLAKCTPVMADKGYGSDENGGTPSRRPKAASCTRCRRTSRETAVNKAISRMRHAVERTSGPMRRWFGAGVARHVGLAKTYSQYLMEAIANNLYRTPGIIVSNCIKKGENMARDKRF